jgi:hypothetical protein
MSEGKAPSARSDLIGGVGWIALGIAIIVGSLAMDRLERFGATLYTAPGLVPGILGAAIVLLGLLLIVRAMRHGAVAGFRAAWRPTDEQRAAARRTALAEQRMRRRAVVAATTAVAATAAVILLFEHVFLVRLP